ncbi:MAG: tRNA ligase subunit PheS family protein, partial [Candidatus Helarchaeota archaeon]
GFQEVNNYIMTGKEIQFKKMNIDESKTNFVEISNPISSSFAILRNDLLPINLDFLSKNTHVNLPIKIFEIGDIVEIDESLETKTKQTRQLAVLYTDYSVSFENIQAALFALMKYLNIDFKLVKLKNTTYINGRAANIVNNGEIIGDLGEISLEILENFDLINPVAAFRLNLTTLYKLI